MSKITKNSDADKAITGDDKKDDKEMDLKIVANIPTCEPSQAAADRLTMVKIDLYRAYPFLGYLVLGTEYLWTEALPTLAATTTPSIRIYINERFLTKGLPTREEAAFVLAHEILHIFLDHVGRQIERGYNAELWNIAADYNINLSLHKLENSSLRCPKSALLDERFDGMSADEIYHKLLEENKGDAQKAISKHGGGDGNIGGDYSDGKQRPFDVVSSEDVSEEKASEIKQKLAQACSITNEQSIKDMGSGAGDLFRQFMGLLEPYIPWQDVLKDFIVNKSAAHYTYNKASRRSTANIIFPRMDGDFIDVTFGVDTSGSMSTTDLNEALTELHSICEEFDNWRVTLISCDTGAHEIGEYESENGDDFTSIDKNLIGGGGTDMTPMVDYVNEMEEPPSVLIILTDGYIPEIENVHDIPTMVVVTSSGNKDLQLNDESIQVLHINH